MIYFQHIRRLLFQRLSTGSILCTFVGYHFKGNRYDLISCIFVGYHLKGNRQDLFSAHSSVTISKVIAGFIFLHIRRLLFQR